MDALITVINLSQEQYQKYVDEIKESNLDKFIKWELIDILNDARQQAQQAESMGWL